MSRRELWLATCVYCGATVWVSEDEWHRQYPGHKIAVCDDACWSCYYAAWRLATFRQRWVQLLALPVHAQVPPCMRNDEPQA